MAIGDSQDILNRIKRLTPTRWFNFTAPLRDAVVGGLSDTQSWLYGFIAYAQQQTRLATATDFWLDLAANDFFGLVIKRRTGEIDSAFSARIRAEIFRERVTRAGMAKALTDLTGKEPIIYEPWNTGDCGGWSSRVVATPGYCGWGTRDSYLSGGLGAGIGVFAIGISPIGVSAGSPVGAGVWGSRNCPASALITVYRPGAQGVPGIGGWASRTTSAFGSLGGWSSRTVPAPSNLGTFAFVTPSEFTGAVTDQEILDCINLTKPEGVGVYARLI